jgi:DNA invertase Pin-like site-specific DNA recombinase
MEPLISNEAPQREKYVAYLRRSKKYHDSTLGIDAQRDTVRKYVKSKGGEIINTYTELESGTYKRRNKRVEIFKAIDECQATGAVLIIAKLDRLARDLEFTSGLYNSGVKFICCDAPEANELTIKMLAVIAENEARDISYRTRVALNEAVKQGKKIGAPGHKVPGCKLTADHRKKAARTLKLMKERNLNNRRGRAFAYSLHINNKSLRDIVKIMNTAGFRSPRGCSINEMTVLRWIRDEKKLLENS